MFTNFIFTNLNAVALVFWPIFFCVVVVRMLRPVLVKNLSYGWLITIAITLHFLYGVVATWGQYRAWASNDFTRVFLETPLSPEVPFPSYLELVRPFFDNTYGYFAFYSFQNFFLSTMVLLIVVVIFSLFLVVSARIHSMNLTKGDIALVVLAMLISGWPGIVILLPIGFACAVLISLVARIMYGVERVPLSISFMIAAPVALVFAIPILTFFNLYPLLKL